MVDGFTTPLFNQRLLLSGVASTSSGLWILQAKAEEKKRRRRRRKDPISGDALSPTPATEETPATEKMKAVGKTEESDVDTAQISEVAKYQFVPEDTISKGGLVHGLAVPLSQIFNLTLDVV